MNGVINPSQMAALCAAAEGWTDDPEFIAPRLTDWRGRTRGRSALLLRPRTTADVAAIVRAAAAQRVALVPQGGRTGLVGGGLPEPEGPSALLSLERMTGIRNVDRYGRTVTVEAGVVLSRVHDLANGHGLRFPLSLAAKGSATIGGLVSTNAGGTQVLRHGTMRSRIVGLEAVLPDGSVWSGLSPLRKDNSGYDLKQLLIGAEGTLGIVTASTLLLSPIPEAQLVGWVSFGEPKQALGFLDELPDEVESFELISEEALQLVLQRFPSELRPVSPAHWHVLFEMAGARGLEERRMFAGAPGSLVIAQSEAQADALWRLRELIPEAERLDGRSVKHDIALPVAATPDYLARVTPRIETNFPGARVFAFGHLGDGNLHYNVRPPSGADRNAWMLAHAEAVTAMVHDEAVARGGSISAEHGIGVWKRAELLRLGDPVKLAAMRAIKAALDPQGIMNPGKIF